MALLKYIQIRYPIIATLLRMLPPLEPNLTPFRPAKSVFLPLNIAGLSRKSILTTKNGKIQYLYEKILKKTHANKIQKDCR
jgi:hypothetical protein